MATITLTATQTVLNRFVNAIAARYSYPDTVNGAPNPQTKAEFARQWLITHIKNEVKSYEAGVASETAIASVNTDVDANIVIT